MKWNIEELQQKINCLENRINLVSDDIQKQSLLLDLYNLKEMVNYSSGKNIYTIDESNYNFNLLNPDHLEDAIEFMNFTRKDILLLLDSTIHIKTVPLNIKKIKKLNFLEYETLLINFLKNFDIELYNLYENYKKNNQIEINKARYEDSKTCLGRCRYIINDGKSYISVRYSSQIKEPTILLHELAHAYQFGNNQNLYTIENKITSLLSEAYPTFLEYVFLDYLKHTEFKNYAYIKEGKKINDLLCIFEYNSNYLENEYTKINYNQKSSLSILMLSKMVALYWLEQYRDNPEQTLSKIQNFNDKYGIHVISDYFKENSIDAIVNSTYNEIKYYLSNYRKRQFTV